MELFKKCTHGWVVGELHFEVRSMFANLISISRDPVLRYFHNTQEVSGDLSCMHSGVRLGNKKPEHVLHRRLNTWGYLSLGFRV